MKLVVIHMFRFPRQNPRKWRLYASLSIVTLAFILRIWRLGAESAWIDEAYSIELAKHTVFEIIQGTASDQHPPLYYLLLHVWTYLGKGVMFARLLSVFIGTFHIGQTIILGTMLGGDMVGLLSGLLLAVSPVHIWYSQEARMYILLASLTSASSAALWESIQGKNRWLLYTLYSSLAIYTHYFAGFVIFSQSIFILIWIYSKKERSILKPWGWSVAVISLAFVPWIQIAFNQALSHTMYWVSAPNGETLIDTLLRLIAGNAVLQLPAIVRWLLTTVIIIFLLWSVYHQWRSKLSYRWGYYYLITWVAIPFCTISLISFIYPIYQFKQYLLVLAPLLTIVTWVAMTLPRRVGLIFVGVLLATSIATVIYQQRILSKDDWHGAAHHIQSQMTSGELILGNPAASKFALSLYINDPFPFQGIPIGYNILSGGWIGETLTPESTGEMLELISSSYSRVWLVEFTPEFWDPDRTISNWLSNHAVLLEDLQFNRIHIRLFQLSRFGS